MCAANSVLELTFENFDQCAFVGANVEILKSQPATKLTMSIHNRADFSRNSTGVRLWALCYMQTQISKVSSIVTLHRKKKVLKSTKKCFKMYNHRNDFFDFA